MKCQNKCRSKNEEYLIIKEVFHSVQNYHSQLKEINISVPRIYLKTMHY